MTEIELKPCPMCHGTELFFNTESCACDELHYVFLGCKGCPIVFGHTEIPHDDEDEYEQFLERAKRRIATLWNNRPKSPLITAVAEVLAHCDPNCEECNMNRLEECPRTRLLTAIKKESELRNV